jgi:hypothetical protein
MPTKLLFPVRVIRSRTDDSLTRQLADARARIVEGSVVFRGGQREPLRARQALHQELIS